MQVVWRRGTASAEFVREALAPERPLKDSTIRTLLGRLEAKGYLTHDVEGRTFLYRAIETPRRLAARAVRQIVDRFCQGSLEDLVTGMVDAKLLDREELARLAKVIRKHQKGGA
jgi:predicted transcriptional regulator